jgi:hypothetical protein
MSKFTPLFIMLASLLALGLGAAPAQALNARSFISALGSDANPCTRPLPCRTLQTAHNNTNAGGEINMLDPAGYGAVTITKAISIVNDGVGSAGVLVPAAGIGIFINAGASDNIHLRGLIIEGAGVGITGIQFNAGQSLTIENCVIRNVTSIGLSFAPQASSTLVMADTLLADNGAIGINVYPYGTAAAVKAVLKNILVHNSYTALQVYGKSSTGTLDVTVKDSVFTDSFYGIYVQTDTSQSVTNVMVSNSVVANNEAGVYSFGDGATVRLAASTVTGNTSGWITAGPGVVLSYGDNNIDGNQFSQAAPPPTAKK